MSTKKRKSLKIQLNISAKQLTSTGNPINFSQQFRSKDPSQQSRFRGHKWLSLVDDEQPPGKPGVAVYVSSNTTKKETYADVIFFFGAFPASLAQLWGLGLPARGSVRSSVAPPKYKTWPSCCDTPRSGKMQKKPKHSDRLGVVLGRVEVLGLFQFTATVCGLLFQGTP